MDPQLTVWPEAVGGRQWVLRDEDPVAGPGNLSR
jgi:hypothetical protein